MEPQYVHTFRFLSNLCGCVRPQRSVNWNAAANGGIFPKRRWAIIDFALDFASRSGFLFFSICFVSVLCHIVPSRFGCVCRENAVVCFRPGFARCDGLWNPYKARVCTLYFHAIMEWSAGRAAGRWRHGTVIKRYYNAVQHWLHWSDSIVAWFFLSFCRPIFLCSSDGSTTISPSPFSGFSIFIFVQRLERVERRRTQRRS